MDFLSKYDYPFSVLGLDNKVEQLKQKVEGNFKLDILKKIIGHIDLTTLNATDTKLKVESMCYRVNEFKKTFPDLPNVAAVCVYPGLVPTVKYALNANGVKIASVSGGFPASQTFLDIKKLESKMALEGGANEIDIVISIGEFLEGNNALIFEEIASLKRIVEKEHLKVIIESGILDDPLKIWEASMIVMEAGADFIKTSTGKITPAATPIAAIVMLEAISEFYKKSGRKVGFKPAGGISTSEDAVLYYTLVKEILGEDWLNPELFRIGASSLANNLLSDISSIVDDKPAEITYF